MAWAYMMRVSGRSSDSSLSTAGAALMLLQVKRKGGSSELFEATRDEMLRVMDEASNPKPIEGKVQ